MKVIRIPAGVYAANCYIVYSENSKEGIVIDPGGDVDDIMSHIKELGLNIKYIILTHGHGDHIGGVKGIREYTKAPVAVHKDDEYMLKDGMANFSSTMVMGTIELNADILLEDGDELIFGDLKAEIIHTPGHTPGGITIKIGDSLFTGDTLFAGSIGRTDFPRSSFATIMDSIKNRLIIYPDDTKVYPGHGPSSTIKNEKASNPFIKQ
ncbi:MBL fold metallo-hydrolase [Tepidimicrobium xylanilyticum]|uniref:Glyoxylase, beta-lactamase superfamily II n=1 Tax=Tepidimicrobium xylanilyticum TaxID=1123352 RepID=A0A1H3DUI4_9FIRM|nr:MBL fold metallo-hydrolase [Tepidimicrobium xylanilyticum]SDX70031.1 Glyoxylase, beta-lactamase superfamily II [Tepidimicrobium xylanilyticum]